MALIRGNALSLSLADESVDLIVTSPPYFALRSYTDACATCGGRAGTAGSAQTGGTERSTLAGKGPQHYQTEATPADPDCPDCNGTGRGHYDGQIGSEATPQEFIDAMLAVTAECVRVLKPSGSMWVNLGDKYAAGHGGSSTEGKGITVRKRSSFEAKPKERPDLPDPPASWGTREATGRNVVPGFRPKSLMGLPWRYALACIDDLGLILRAEVIWSKPNGLPESVTDRVRRSHEQWFCFQRDLGGDVVEPGAQSLPLCSLCGRPADTRATLVARLHEAESGVEGVDLPDEVRADQRVQGEDCGGAEQPGVVGAGSATVPLAVPVDADVIEDAADLLHDSGVPVVDQDAKVGAAVPAVTEGDAALPVDDPGQPSDVCRCSHPLIIDDEPWIPQALAAELMQMVADGEADAQAVADFLSGDYARSHSTWFHFTKEPRYYSAVDAIREPHDFPNQSRTKGTSMNGGKASGGPHARADTAEFCNPLGKLPGSVWTIPTEPLRVPDHLGVDHFAAFPSEWPRRLILGWSPSGVCVECGQGRRPVVAKEQIGGRIRTRADTPALGAGRQPSGHMAPGALSGFTTEATITGYACDCPDTDAHTRPAVVLDPFTGTGTTVAVANALGRHGIGVDLSADYLKLARWRCADPKLRAKVLGVDPPAPQVTGQLDLLEHV